MDPADVAEVIEDLPARGQRRCSSGCCRETWRRWPSSICRRTSRRSWSATLGNEQLKNLLNEMAPDDRTRLLEELPAEVTRRALTHAVARGAEGGPRSCWAIRRRSAGRYMTPEYLTLRREPDRGRGAGLHAHPRPGPRDAEHPLHHRREGACCWTTCGWPRWCSPTPRRRIADIHDRQLVSIPATADREEVHQLLREVRPGGAAGDGLAGGAAGHHHRRRRARRGRGGGHRGHPEAWAAWRPWRRPTWTSASRRWCASAAAGWRCSSSGEMLTATAMGHYQDEHRPAPSFLAPSCR